MMTLPHKGSDSDCAAICRT